MKIRKHKINDMRLLNKFSPLRKKSYKITNLFPHDVNYI